MLESPQFSPLSQLQPANNQTHFDLATGTLFLFGDEAANTFQQAIAPNGYLELAIDNNKYSSDTQSPFFAPFLIGATDRSIQNIIFDGGDGDDKLTLGGQLENTNLSITADDSIDITGSLTATNNLSILSDKLTLNQATLTATDNTNGGTIHLLSKDISVINSAIAATGSQSGGTILIGGDYQGKGTVPNAINTTIDSSTTIKADALQTGNGGKIIVWADDTTKYSGNISAKGGAVSGDGGFAEVSGKQNLAFQGTANLTAPNGQVGTLLLDPENVIISDAAPLPDDPPEPLKIQASTLQQIAGNVSVVANNSINLLTSLNFVNPGNGITFTAGSGGFYSSGDIYAQGRNVTISAPIISSTGNILTSSFNNAKGGAITLTAANGINVGILQTYSANNTGGNISLNSNSGSINAGSILAAGKTDSGKVFINAENNITVGDILSTSFTGNGKPIDLTSTTGFITVPGIVYSGGGNINLNATQGINVGQYISSVCNSGNNGGNIKLTSTLAGINTSGIYSFAWGGTTVLGGNINLQAATNISTGTLSSSSAEGKGGNINVTSTGGAIDTGEYTVSSNSVSGSAGNIKLKATAITTGLVDAGANGNGNGGAIRLETSGNIATSAIVTNSNGSGNSGNITLISTNGNINATGNSVDTTAKLIYAGANSGTAGKVNIQAEGNIIVPDIGATSNTGTGNDIKLNSNNGGVEVQGEVLSWSNAGNAGDIRIEAKNNVKTGAVDAHAGQSVSNLVEPSALSSVNAAGGGAVSLNASRVVNIPAPSGILPIGSPLAIPAISVPVLAPTPTPSLTPTPAPVANSGLVGNSINPGFASALLSPTGSGNGGKVTLISNLGNVEAGYIRSDSAGGIGGNIKVDSDGDITAEWLRADSNLGTGGKIELVADKFIKVTSSTQINGNNFSIFTDSVGDSSAPIFIKHSTQIVNNPAPFIVGDTSVNGTANGISDGVAIMGVSATHTIYPSYETYTNNNIHITAPILVAGAPTPPVSKPSPQNLWSSFKTLYGTLFTQGLQAKFGSDASRVIPIADFSVDVSKNYIGVGAVGRGGERTGAKAAGSNDPLNYIIYIAKEIYESNTSQTLSAIYGTIAHEAANILDFVTSASKNFANGNNDIPLDESNYGNPCLATNPEYTDGDSGAAVEFWMFGQFAYPDVIIKPDCPK